MVPVNQSGSWSPPPKRSRKKIAVVIDAADLDDEDDRVAEERPRVELDERITDRGDDDVAREDALLLPGHRVSSSRARFSSSTFTPGSPKIPSQRPSVFSSISSATRSSESPRSFATRARLEAVRSRARCAGRCPEAEVVTASTGMSPIREAGVVRALELQDRERRAPARPSRDRGSSGRGSRRSSRPALYSGAVAEGRGWKYSGFVNACAASFEPTTLPSRSTRLPFALSENASCAKPVKTQRVDEAEDERQHDDGDDGAAEGARIMARAPPRSARA